MLSKFFINKKNEGPSKGKKPGEKNGDGGNDND